MSNSPLRSSHIKPSGTSPAGGRRAVRWKRSQPHEDACVGLDEGAWPSSWLDGRDRSGSWLASAC